jgi:outer membrane protein/protease secretion system outer membrane protein
VELNVPLFAGGYVNSRGAAGAGEVTRVEQTMEATRSDLGLRVYKEFRV